MKLELYKTRNKQFRWRLTAKNGEVIAASTEAFTTKAKAKKNFVLIGKAVFELALESVK